MIPFKKCSVSGGDVIEKEVEKLLRGGNHTAVLKVKAEVCTHCGERFYTKETILQFENIRTNLEHQDFSKLQPLGQSFKFAG
jgi:YgiT-type zinc finger domain-containing protein